MADTNLVPGVSPEGVRWAYRLILGREPENDEVVADHVRKGIAPTDLARQFLTSPEFLSALRTNPKLLPAEALTPLILGRFKRSSRSRLPGEAGFFRDFLGVRTDCAFFPAGYARYAGGVAGRDGLPDYLPLHDAVEWRALLQSVLEARARFTAVELGAGWGPWLVAGAKAAERAGITELHLAGVEASAEHFQFMLRHFQANGLDPNAQTLVNGVVGPEDGVALFPRLHNPSQQWGAKADYGDTPTDSKNAAETDEVPAVSLPTLLGRLPPVDFLHCDVQGAEADILTAGLDVLCARVRRMVVGTHGRRIEQDLLDMLPARGWILETEEPCAYRHLGSRLDMFRDGVQIWWNTASVGH